VTFVTALAEAGAMVDQPNWRLITMATTDLGTTFNGVGLICFMICAVIFALLLFDEAVELIALF
jgi:hypothetical protein